MLKFFAALASLREIIAFFRDYIIDPISNLLEQRRHKKREEEYAKRKEARHERRDEIESESKMPVSDESDEKLRDAHRRNR